MLREPPVYVVGIASIHMVAKLDGVDTTHLRLNIYKLLLPPWADRVHLVTINNGLNA